MILGWLTPPWIQKTTCKLYMDFQLRGRLEPLTPVIVQGSTVLTYKSQHLPSLDVTPSCLDEYKILLADLPASVFPNL